MQLDEITKIIIERRKVLKITQERTAALAGISIETINGIERGIGNPTFATLSKIADVLGMEIKLAVKQPITK